MSGFLLDTAIVAELRKPEPAPAVVRFVAAQAEDDLFISDLTFAEIRFGIEELADADRRAQIDAWLDHELRPLFADRTLAIEADVLLRWRQLVELGRKHGHAFGQLELLTAACALENGLIIVSRGVMHFMMAGAPVLDPWEGSFVPANGAPIAISDLDRPGLLGRLLNQRSDI